MALTYGGPALRAVVDLGTISGPGRAAGGDGANLAGADLVVIDAADVLDGPTRSGLFSMLGEAELPAVVCMTLSRREQVPDSRGQVSARAIGSKTASSNPWPKSKGRHDMQTENIVLERGQALALYRKYREHQHYSEPIDLEIQRVYQAIAKGQVVIKALASVVAAGVGEDGLPKLAIVRADATKCFVEMRTDGAARMSADRWPREPHTRRYIDFKAGSFPAGRSDAAGRRGDHAAGAGRHPAQARDRELPRPLRGDLAAGAAGRSDAAAAHRRGRPVGCLRRLGSDRG